MRILKKLVVSTLAAALAIGCMTVFAGEENQEIFIIEEQGSEVVLTGLTEYGKTLEHVDIPEGVTVIGKDVFAGTLDENPGGENQLSAIQTVTIPETVTKIEVGAFAVSGLTEVVIPDSVTSIGTNSFQGSANLGTVVLSNSLTEIPEAAFAETNMESMEIPEGVTSIGMFAFGKCPRLDVVVLPASLETIGEAAFVGCEALATVKFAEGSKIQSIHPAAFMGCALNIIQMPAECLETVGTEWCGDVEPRYFEKDGNFLISQYEGETILIGLSEEGNGLTHVDIPEGVTVIGKDAFAGEMTRTMGNVLSSVETVSIPASVTTIEVGAFAVSGLKEILVPETVTSIGTNAFQGSANLSSITFLAKVDSIAEATFAETAISTIELPEGIKSIGVFAFGACRNLTSIVIPASVETLSEAAFVACGLTNVEFADETAIQSINPAAFVGCESIETISIPAAAQDIVGSDWSMGKEITWR